MQKQLSQNISLDLACSFTMQAGPPQILELDLSDSYLAAEHEGYCNRHASK